MSSQVHHHLLPQLLTTSSKILIIKIQRKLANQIYWIIVSIWLMLQVRIQQNLIERVLTQVHKCHAQTASTKRRKFNNLKTKLVYRIRSCRIRSKRLKGLRRRLKIWRKIIRICCKIWTHRKKKTIKVSIFIYIDNYFRGNDFRRNEIWIKNI